MLVGKLCHYPYHEFKEGVCSECGKTKEEIEALYRVYYPSFKPGTEVFHEGAVHDFRYRGA